MKAVVLSYYRTIAASQKAEVNLSNSFKFIPDLEDSFHCTPVGMIALPDKVTLNISGSNLHGTWRRITDSIEVGRRPS